MGIVNRFCIWQMRKSEAIIQRRIRIADAAQWIQRAKDRRADLIEIRRRINNRVRRESK